MLIMKLIKIICSRIFLKNQEGRNRNVQIKYLTKGVYGREVEEDFLTPKGKLGQKNRFVNKEPRVCSEKVTVL